MKSYKEYGKTYIGSSDIASLVFRGPCKLQEINFGEDGCYHAYIVDENAKIGSHYELTATFKNWLTVYDDYGKTLHLNTHHVYNVYQAGSFGIIIQTLDKLPD